MKLSFESPLSLLEESLKYNDYQYILPHLTDSYPEYADFMLKYGQDPNAFIIMDNGLFEGVSHTDDDLIAKINKFEPDIFIVPDAWNKSDKTFRNAKKWINIIKPKLNDRTELMVVIQGKTLGDIIGLYSTCYDLGYRHFAFNHSLEFYQNIFPHIDKLVSQMMGRILLINVLLDKGIIDISSYHHLLGASNINEFKYYKGYDFIKSADTSAPIINAFKGILFDLGENYNKPPEKIEEFINTPVSSNIINNINHNIKQLKSCLM
jgi:hypothetical protein